MPIGKKIRGGTGASPPGPGAVGSKPDRQGGPASPAGFRLDAAPAVPACLQPARQAGHAPRPGYLKPGGQLPGVRDVVASLAINPDTVLFTSALRDSRERRGGQADRGAAGDETEGAA